MIDFLGTSSLVHGPIDVAGAIWAQSLKDTLYQAWNNGNGPKPETVLKDDHVYFVGAYGAFYKYKVIP